MAFLALMFPLFWLICFKGKVFLLKYSGIQLLLFFCPLVNAKFIMDGENVLTLPGFSYTLKNILMMVK